MVDLPASSAIDFPVRDVNVFAYLNSVSNASLLAEPANRSPSDMHAPASMLQYAWLQNMKMLHTFTIQQNSFLIKSSTKFSLYL